MPVFLQMRNLTTYPLPCQEITHCIQKIFTCFYKSVVNSRRQEGRSQRGLLCMYMYIAFSVCVLVDGSCGYLDNIREDSL